MLAVNLHLHEALASGLPRGEGPPCAWPPPMNPLTTVLQGPRAAQGMGGGSSGFCSHEWGWEPLLPETIHA